MLFFNQTSFGTLKRDELIFEFYVHTRYVNYFFFFFMFIVIVYVMFSLTVKLKYIFLQKKKNIIKKHLLIVYLQFN